MKKILFATLCSALFVIFLSQSTAAPGSVPDKMPPPQPSDSAILFQNADEYLSLNRELKEEHITYKVGDLTMIGYLVWDDKFGGHLPGVLVAHEWWGLNDYSEMRARRMAEQGYVAFACDLYGNGFNTEDVEEAQRRATPFYTDRNLFRERINAGLKVLKEYPLCDSTRVAAIGYCFGGSAVLELGRSGADVEAIISFHGILSNPTPADATKIKGRVLVLQGGADPFVTPADVAKFSEEMNAAQADWKLITYAGAMHSFTNPNNTDSTKGTLYNELADRRSMDAANAFLKDVFTTQEKK